MSRPHGVSVVVPCFNAGGVLLDTVDSLLGQTTVPDEILVVDDASTDPATLAALAEAEGRDRVRVSRTGANQGVARARNRGIDETSGEAVAFLDGDDLFHPGAIEAFLAALEAHPHAGFAYPTVTTFGNRSDTFPAPPFDLYLLHHVNICPIAGMVRRGVLDEGLRFDPAIVLGHEDWDFWLRVAAAGHLGVAAPDAVMFYRRVGVTRMDLGNRLEGGFDRELRRIRPEVFAPGRLVHVKRVWAPAVTVVADDPAALDTTAQTCLDLEVVPPGRVADARGRVLLVPMGDAARALAEPDLVEAVAAAHESEPWARAGAWLRREAVTRDLSPFTRVQASDLRGATGDLRDVCAVSLPTLGLAPLPGDGGLPAVRAHVLGILAREAPAPLHVAWRVGHPAPRLDDASLPQGAEGQPGSNHASATTWSQDARSGLRPALPWRTATPGALFGEEPAAAVVELRAARDEGTESWALYGPEEDLTPGMRLEGASCVVLAAPALGAVALLRIVHPATGRRSIAAGTAPDDWRTEALVGYAEAHPVPGTAPLDLTDPGGPHRRLCWVYPPVATAHPDWLDDPLVGARRWWRAIDPATGMHAYGLARRGLARTLRVEGPVCELAAVPPADRTARAVHALVRAGGGHPVGFTADPGRAHGAGVRAAGLPVGWLAAEPGPGLRPVWLRRNPSTGDLLCSNAEGEGAELGYADAELVGYARA